MKIWRADAECGRPGASGKVAGRCETGAHPDKRGRWSPLRLRVPDSPAHSATANHCPALIARPLSTRPMAQQFLEVVIHRPALNIAPLGSFHETRQGDRGFVGKQRSENNGGS